MEIQSRLSYLHISPRKTRLVAGLIRGMSVPRAEQELEHAEKRASLPLLKLLRSAQASAAHTYQLSKDKLYVKNIRVDQGPVLKRHRPRAFGRAALIRKRTSHISLVLETRERISPSTFAKKHEKPILRDATEVDMKEVITRMTSEQTEKQEKESRIARPKKGFLPRVFKRKAI